jgi:Predicted phosphoesterases, related to the Icc protein
MKILLLADIESKYLWDFFEKSKLEGIDLVLSAGDLAPQYLSFIATFTTAPVLYVHGNHDTCYDDTPPDGCVCIDDKIYNYKGLRIMGLGGSMCYNMSKYQYTDAQMMGRYLKLMPKIFFSKGIDILLTHSPALGINDQEDLPHRGFKVFVDILDRFHPKYFIHGHVHLNYGRGVKRVDTYKDTTIINAFERYILEI